MAARSTYEPLSLRHDVTSRVRLHIPQIGIIIYFNIAKLLLSGVIHIAMQFKQATCH